MSKLPQVSGSDVARALQKIGFSVRRQHGSHIIMRRDEPFAQTVVRTTARSTAAHCAILRPTDLWDR
jgi:predicted RNA binding protein YcfA (HicA-like mRNA interferase family)